ncbi:MAG: DUF1080 domain-containing protein [Planctomycetota bacterium]
MALRGGLLLVALAAGACHAGPAASPWIELFDGAALGAFAVTDFGGQGPVEVRDGKLCLGFGSPLTGVTWTGVPPSGDYELEVVAAREDGADFFCGLTFPVGDDHLTLVLGGWGGTMCGLSSLDGNDAAHNPTRTLRRFVTGRAYTVRVVVTADHVATMLNGEPLCAVDRRSHRLGLRPEVLLSRPLGVAAFATAAAVARVRWRPLGTRP